MRQSGMADKPSSWLRYDGYEQIALRGAFEGWGAMYVISG